MNNKTDYNQRFELLKSEKPRLVVRKTNKRIIGQIIKYEPNGDKTLITVTSDMLKKYGWTYSFKSVPASYLTGLLLGVMAIHKNINEAVLDIGLNVSTKGNKLYAVAKGFNDAGVKIKIGKEIIPDDARISGEHIKNHLNNDIVEKFKSVKESILKGEHNE